MSGATMSSGRLASSMHSLIIDSRGVIPEGSPPATELSSFPGQLSFDASVLRSGRIASSAYVCFVALLLGTHTLHSGSSIVYTVKCTPYVTTPNREDAARSISKASSDRIGR